MASAVLTNTPTVINGCNDATDQGNWQGDTFSLEPDNKVEGANSVACVMTPNAGNSQEIYVDGTTWDFAPDVHIRVWINLTFNGNLQTEANDGLQIYIYDGTNSDYWTVAGSDTYAGGWTQFVIYTGNTPTEANITGTYDSITRIGMRVKALTKPRNVPANTWLDQWTYGDGFTITGGTNGDEIDWSHVAALDLSNAYGIVTRLDDVYFMAGDVTVGNGATATWFKSGQKAQFKDLDVLSTLYGVTFEGSACNVDIEGGSYGAAGIQDYLFDASDTNLNAFDLTGVQFENANSVLFAAGQSITNNVFNQCLQVDPSTATFTGNNFSNSEDTSGAVLFPSTSSNISKLNFVNCDFGVEYDATSDSTDPTFTDFVFDDVAGNYDVTNSSGASATIILSGTSNANSYNPSGSSIVFDNPKAFSFTLSPSITGYEWRLYEVTAIGSLDGSVEKAGTETATTDNQTYNYTYSSDQPIGVQIIGHANDIEESITYYTLGNADQSVTILLTKDDNN